MCENFLALWPLSPLLLAVGADGHSVSWPAGMVFMRGLDCNVLFGLVYVCLYWCVLLL